MKRQIAWCLVDRAGTDGAVAVGDAAFTTLQCAGVVTVAWDLHRSDSASQPDLSPDGPVLREWE